MENWKDFHKVLQSCDPECTDTLNRSPPAVLSLFARSTVWEASWWCVSCSRFKVSPFPTITFFLSFNMAGIAGDIESFVLPKAYQKEKTGGRDSPFLMWPACDLFSFWMLETLVSLTLFQHFRGETSLFSTKEIVLQIYDIIKYYLALTNAKKSKLIH